MGIKGGIDLAGSLQWLNPEGFNGSNGAPKKIDPKKAVGEYVDIAKVSTGVAAIQGLAAKLGLQCDYKEGRFVIAAKAGLCLSLGGSGSVALEVGAEQIGQFFMCMAHQFKQADYRKVADLMQQEAFETFNRILYLAVVQKGNLESFVGKE